MLAEFQKHIEDSFSELKQSPFLLGVSGGVDSIVLAHLCGKSNLNFSMAHCNFRLRGAESDKDEGFVRELADQLSVELHVTHFDTIGYVNKNKVSLQMAARELRYRWFEQIMQEFGYAVLVTAHHADDNLETFLINLSRGTGLDGLTGIPSNTNRIARPLLVFSRNEILDYAKSEKLDWREDESNADTKYLRNKIRHDVVPGLKELHPTFVNNFQNTLENLKGSSAVLHNHINELKKELFIENDGIISISIKELGTLSPVEPYLYELFNDYGFTAWDDVKGLLTASSGKEVLSETHRLLKNRQELLLQELEVSDGESFFLSEETESMDNPIKLEVKAVDNYEKANKPNILYLDKKTLKYPLMLRKWQEGDYFYPLGMKGKKKVSKFFKDEKMDMISKEKQWLLYSDDQLVWIVGKRADERFKVTAKTKTILQITLH